MFLGQLGGTSDSVSRGLCYHFLQATLWKEIARQAG
jgi:hypothetical protein